MFMSCRTFLRASLAFLLGLAILQPLCAQLDPRLQATKTDFLDLYQKSTTAALKPEVVTIFDFSGSMDAFMFHPLYINQDRDDNNPDQKLSFTLQPAGPDPSVTNAYTIVVTSSYNGSVSTSIDLTVGSVGDVTVSNATTSGNRTSNKVETAPSVISVSGSGSTRTLSWTITITNNSNSSKAVNFGDAWNGSSNLSPTTHPSTSENLAKNTSKSVTNTTAWTIPAYKPPQDLPARVSSSIQGTGVLPTFVALIRPDGTIISDSNFITVDTTLGLNGFTGGKGDVRNWVRQASHARFEAMVGSDKRTIDIPIPWKITSATSSGNPLSSRVKKDEIVKKGVTYGSDLDIELDTTYKKSSGDYVLTNDATRTTLDRVNYTKDYIGWLFASKYTDGSYVGKYIVFDAVTGNLAGGQGTATGELAWGQGWGGTASSASKTFQVPLYDGSGAYTGKERTELPSVNIVPGMTRVQAVKRAAIETWIANQATVLWAFRFLQESGESTGDATDITNASVNGWKLLNNIPATGSNTTATGNSVKNMKVIANTGTASSTPLTYAIANTLAQYDDPANIFKSVEKSVTGVVDDTPSSCMNHFLILFTDGNDNNDQTPKNANASTPYLVSDTIELLKGNQSILTTKTNIDRTGPYWNIFTFAAMAAHLTDSSLGETVNSDYMAVTQKTTGSSGAPSTFLPFAIKNRGTVDFGSYGHRVTTMTLGVSLGGFYTDNETTYPVSGKRALFRAAVLGDPGIKSGKVTDFHGFDPVDDWKELPSNPDDFPEVGQRGPNATYFFDGSDPEKLALMLQRAIQATQSPANINSTSNPDLPFIGAALGKQVYLGKFVPPSNGGPIWSGDLLMFATTEVNGQTKILDHNANITTILDSTTAQWSAREALKDSNRLWSARKLFTRLPGDATNSEKGFTAFSDTGTAFEAIKGQLLTRVPDGTTSPSVGPYPAVARTPATTDAFKKQVVQKAMGADLASPADGTTGRPTKNRSNLMGDIINASPVAVAYKVTDTLASAVGSGSRLSISEGDRFRLVLTGTNQGWLHAFGEVTRDTTKVDSDGKRQTLVTGSVDELWGFMPTDFLGQLDYVFGGFATNGHRFMVDGAPIVYHLDLPPSTGGSGNGLIDSNERAVAIFGLRKGGRSYYAIDIHNPASPALKWSLCPDEAANFTDDRIETGAGAPSLATVKAILANMGFSTSTPALGRVLFNGVVRDAVFFGGGLSTADVEANFKNATGAVPKLGRSVLALDVYSGKVLAAVDLTTVSSSIACIPAGLVPFEFFLNSGMAQRAYFLDYAGGLWSWGSGQTAASGSFRNYRLDTSDLAKWTTTGTAGGTAGIRAVAKDESGNGAKYSTLPAPFRVGSFRGAGKTTSGVTGPTPAAVGVAMVSGDRNNPVDLQYLPDNSNRPLGHRLTVVFDRQDSLAWGLDTAGIQDTKLIDFSSGKTEPPGIGTDKSKLITPGADTFYLTNSGNPYFGYFVSLPPRGAAPDYFISKGITEPIVVAGSLFYSYFTPTTVDPCSGGDGITTSSLICDVYQPLVTDTRDTVACRSGVMVTWAGVASTFSAYGTRGVIQGGAVSIGGTLPPGASKTAMELKTIVGGQQQRFPKVRVWRSVQ